METYKMQINTRKNLLSLAAAAMLVIYAGLLFYSGGLPALPSFIKGFHTGAFIGAELCLVFFLAKYVKASKHDAELKKLYIEENDERSVLILRNASTLGTVIILIGLAVAAVIAGFFNPVIFYTLLTVLLFVLVTFFSLVKYYTSKL